MTTTVRIAAVKRVPMNSMRKPALVAGSGSARRRVLRPCFEAPRLGVEVHGHVLFVQDAILHGDAETPAMRHGVARVDAKIQQDLVQKLGVASARIYAAFGSKEALFRATVAHYEAHDGGFAERALREEPTARRAIERVLKFPT